jgi:hypothetical protein
VRHPLYAVLYGCDIWFFIMREEGHWKKMFGPERGEIKETGDNSIMMNFIICIRHKIKLR